MKTQVEQFVSSADWTPSGTGTVAVHLENEHEQYIAGGLAKSLIFSFPVGNLNEHIEKTIAPAIDVSDKDVLVFSVFSFRRAQPGYRKAADFQYRLHLSATESIDFPTWGSFTDITVPLGAIASIDRVRLEALHNEKDFLVCSYMLAVRDELPRDIFVSLKESLESVAAELLGKGVQIGTVTAAAAASSIQIVGDARFAQQYAVLRIDDGVNSEVHMLAENDETDFQLDPDVFDGGQLLNAFTAAPVYLTFPIEFARFSTEILLPGIVIWGLDPEPVGRTSQLAKQTVAHDGVGFSVRREGQLLRYQIPIHIMARQAELFAEATRIVRRVLSRNVLWVNGRKHDVTFDIKPIETELVAESVDQLHEIQHMVNIEVREEIETTETGVPAAAAATLTVTPQ